MKLTDEDSATVGVQRVSSDYRVLRTLRDDQLRGAGGGYRDERQTGRAARFSGGPGVPANVRLVGVHRMQDLDDASTACNYEFHLGTVFDNWLTLPA